MKNNRKLVIFLLLAFVFLTKAGFVFALEINYPSIGGISLDSSSTFPEYARYFFNIGIWISTIIAATVIAAGGIYYIISRGTGKFTDEGKEWVKAGVLGLALILSSYLIASTINPDLVVFNLRNLVPSQFQGFFPIPSQSNAIVMPYQEIPIGTLTETLLSRTMDCYEYDNNGDPISLPLKTDGYGTVAGPSLMKHDQVDCFSKLSKAIETKSKIIKSLSAEIVKLMQQCPCSGTCSEGCTARIACPNNGACFGPAFIGSENVCQNNCKNVPCKGTGDPCPAGVKNKIEHGPILVENICTNTEPCGFEKAEYKGLDEFRTQQSSVSQFVERKVKVNNEEVIIIDTGDCPFCKPGDQRCLENKKNCLKQSPWGKLKLVEQIMYLKEKAEEIKTNIEKDRKQLVSGEDALGQCYLAKTSVDFLQDVEKTKKTDIVIMTQKPFSDSKTQQPIDVYKYCKGYQYTNSECFHSCQKICPGNTIDDFKKYASCNNFDCDNANTPAEKAQCKKDLKKCMDDVINDIKCPNSEFTNFKDCLDTCQGSCNTQCQLKYSSCPDELAKCKKTCESNSKCLIDNADKCVFNFKTLTNCTNPANCQNECGNDAECKAKCSANATNETFLKNCYENSLLCKNCSDQNAGYPDCLKSPYSLADKYSSSFVFQKPAFQICPEAYAQVGIRCTAQNQQTNQNGTQSTCLDCYPEASKCPSASKCPECPCSIEQTEVISQNPVEFDPKNECPAPPEETEKTTNYRVCSAQCNEYDYNDDPLTFYCKSTFLDNPRESKNEPLGADKICLKSNEIPVGKTVDDAEAWAKEITEKMGDFIKKINEELDYINKIGQERNYCKCDSKCEAGEPVCQTKCIYSESIDNKGKRKCECIKSPCSGNTCQKMINFLKGKTADDECSKGVEDKGVKWYALQISEQLKVLQNFITEGGRSDILKELEYSRKKTDTCSITQNNYEEKMQILSCQRVMDNVMSPIIDKTDGVIVGSKNTPSWCYGKDLGKKILNTPEPLMDNWFCCESRVKTKQ